MTDVKEHRYEAQGVKGGKWWCNLCGPMCYGKTRAGLQIVRDWDDCNDHTVMCVGRGEVVDAVAKRGGNDGVIYSTVFERSVVMTRKKQGKGGRDQG